jgi:hypothetical protein
MSSLVNRDRKYRNQGMMFRIPEHLCVFCEELAAVERRTPAAMMRVLVEEAVEARETARLAKLRAIAQAV